MILVAGATGNLGNAVVEQLLKTEGASNFAVLARDAEKARPLARRGIELRIADYDNLAASPDVFKGIDKLLLISTMSHERGPQQKRVVDAAVAAGVRHIVYTGLAIKDIASSGVNALMASHFETEDHIRASGVTWTFLRNTMYAEAIPVIIGPRALEVGIQLPAGEGRVPFALRAEMGEAAANVLTQPGHENRIYEITGPEAWSWADVAAALSARTGRALPYVDITPEALIAGLQAAGMPEFGIYLTSGTLADTRTGQYDIVTRDLEHLLGREPMGLSALIANIF